MPTREIDQGFLAHPDPDSRSSAPARGGGAVPGVVVIHDVWGLGAHYRDLAGRFAKAGFAALAVNLYRDLGDTKITDPGAWMRDLSDPAMLGHVEAAVGRLAEDPLTRGHGVAVVGFCMGGTYALMAGCVLDDVAAVVPFYGLLSHDHGLLHSDAGLDPAKKPRSPLAMAAELRCPLLGFFGADDPYVPLDDVEQLRGRLATSGQADTELVVVEGAGHAFMNDTRAEAYRPEAARAAWDRTIAFLRERTRTR